MDKREKLLRLVKQKALRFGEFVLASGRRSSYYINGKLVSLDPEGLYLLSETVLEKIKEESVNAVGGLTLGADPIVGGVITLAEQKGLPLKGFIVRKEPKSHGTRSRIEGPLVKGDRVVILDDVTTTGGSSLQAIRAVEELGCEVVKVVALADRGEGAKEKLAKGGYRFEAIFDTEDLGIEAENPDK